ncbi:MAG: hypothetical protein P4L73_19950 [Caulobacteraceae bacterium]|nr:hypothetical protein [Caulobacteraceae bacterium]
MDRAQVHFELFVRRHRRAPWVLALATEDRQAAFEAADDVLAREAGAAVRLCKETRDARTGDFRPLTLLERGVRPEPRRWRGRQPGSPRPGLAASPACARPQDLYAGPAREAIGGFLSGWFARNRVTPFELLHRADLAERLEACEAELSAALYNAALDQAAARGAPLEPTRRALDTLARRTIERIVADDPEVGFRLGVAVAARLGRHPNWKDKLEVLLDLIDAAPEEGQPAAVARRVLQQPLTDILLVHGELDEILGPGLALGDQLLILAQIASAPAIAAVAADEAALGRAVPRLRGIAARLALTLHGRAAFARARRAVGRRVLSILAGEARLWPDDPVREVEGVKALARLLTLPSRLVGQDEVAAALAARWRRLTGPGFVEARLGLCRGALEEADVLLDLVEAAVGRASVEALGRRLLALLADRGFEQEARFSPDPLAVGLGRLAGLAARIRGVALRTETRLEAERRLRRLAVRMKADAATLCA